MKVKKYNTIIIFLLLSLTLINMIYNSFFIYKPDAVFKDQENDQSISDKLKLSLIQNWNISWDSGSNDHGYGIAVEESTGYIYVTGYNYTDPTTIYSDIILVKYDNNGEELWNVTWDNGDSEYGYDVAIDSLGYVYVTGSNITSSVSDVLLLKFNSSGHLEWIRSWDNGFYDGAWALTIDADDNIYVAGTTFSTSYDLLLLKYNSSGHYQWNSTINAPDYQYGYDIVLDSINNIYIAGLNGSATASDDLLVVKLDSSGKHIWNRTWGQYGVSDRGYGIALDSKNNVYISGKTSSYGAVGIDFVTVKYDNNGNWQWNQTWGTIGTDEAWSIAIDSADNIYTCGYTVFCNVSILKYSSSGNLIWDRTWANNSIYKYWLYDIFIDSLDKIYVTGYNRTGPTGLYDIFVGQYSIEYPGIFTLSCDSGFLDTDGNFNLSWTSSSGANNYSIYQYSSFISEINGTIKLLAEQNATSPYTISGYSNGTYYFKAVAFNNYGNRTSNCINLTVEIPPSEPFEPPGSFTLSSDAGSPDPDGNFTLTWTSSGGANNYSIYQYSSYITEINDSLTLLEQETDALSLPLSGYSNGEYYFIVVASNNFGNTFSNNYKIEVEITPEKHVNGVISGYNLIFLIIAIIGVASILRNRRLKFK